MTNAPHILETALLLLAVFLVGAGIGYFARFVASRTGRKPVIAAVAVAAPVPESGPQLVVAPEIAQLPVPPRPTVEERFAAAAGKTTPEASPLMPAVKMPEVAKLPEFATSPLLQPARVAGETLSGKHIGNPEHPAALPASVTEAAIAPPDAEPVAVEMPEPAPQPVTLDEVRAELEAQMAPAADAEPMPVEEKVEPVIAAEPEVVVTDTPVEVAAEMQEIVSLAAEAPIPEVVAEERLVESSFDVARAIAAPADAVPVAEENLPSPAMEMNDIDDETAAMRAIEGGWSPRRSAVPRSAAALPEGVSAEAAVAASSAAVANATAVAAAVLEDIAPVQAKRAAGGFGRPAGLDQPRDGGKDNFSQIKGLAPTIESSLNGLGIYHYDQIADWDHKGVIWIENHFGFKGRVARERWQEQARELSRGRGFAARAIRR